MKNSIMKHLVCVNCSCADLRLNVTETDGDEIITGLISCRCGAEFPILRGIPRMLRESLLNEIHTGEEMPETRTSISDGEINKSQISENNDKVKKQTMRAFGYEWNTYSDYEADNYYNWMPEGFDPAEGFKNKLGLEVGCGAGRHAERTSSWAKEHIAVDLSPAVEAAFARNRHLPNCHIVQADAFDLPFRDDYFDYVYCLGVLQHFHDPVLGFNRISKKVHPQGVLLVNVYQASRPVLITALAFARRLTVRMPAPLLNALCYVAGTVDFAYCGLWKAIDKVGMAKALGWIFPQRTREYAKHDFKTITADWYDRLACPMKFHFRREDLQEWYEANGYAEITVTPYWKAFWNGLGVKQAAMR